MQLESGLRLLILDVTASTPCGVFLNKAPEGQLKKFVLFGRDSREPDPLYNRSARLITDTFGVDVRADKIADAYAIADAIRDGLDGFNGPLPNDYEVQGIEVEDQSDDYIPRTGDGDDGLHTVSLKLTVYHSA